LLSSELDKLKYDVSDTIDNKFENVIRQMEGETANLKETFQTLSDQLKTTGVELHNSFEEK
jgi:hypothetical protein